MARFGFGILMSISLKCYWQNFGIFWDFWEDVAYNENFCSNLIVPRSDNRLQHNRAFVNYYYDTKCVLRFSANLKTGSISSHAVCAPMLVSTLR